MSFCDPTCDTNKIAHDQSLNMFRFETTLLQHFLSWCCFHGILLRHIKKTTARKSERDDIMSSLETFCQCVSLSRAEPYLKERLKVLNIDLMRWDSRFHEFINLPKHLNSWASKSLNKFAATVNHIAH